MNPLTLIAGPIANLVSSVVSRIWPDKTEEELANLTAQVQVAILESDLMKAQLTVDANEALSPNVFIAGWRPFLGWCCGSIFAWNYLVLQILQFIAVSVTGHALPVPTFDMNIVMQVLLAMLGIGVAGLRTFEKVSGVSHLHN